MVHAIYTCLKLFLLSKSQFWVFPVSRGTSIINLMGFPGTCHSLGVTISEKPVLPVSGWLPGAAVEGLRQFVKLFAGRKTASSISGLHHWHQIDKLVRVKLVK